MKDTEFEQLSERATLLTNKGYFNRFRELAPEIGIVNAWLQVESELPFGIRRYSDFAAFERAKKREAEGTLSETVYLRK